MFAQYYNKPGLRFFKRILYGRVEFTHIFLKQVSLKQFMPLLDFFLCVRFS